MNTTLKIRTKKMNAGKYGPENTPYLNNFHTESFGSLERNFVFRKIRNTFSFYGRGVTRRFLQVYLSAERILQVEWLRIYVFVSTKDPVALYYGCTES